MSAKTQRKLHLMDSNTNLESSSSASQPNNRMEQHCTVTRQKRKTCESLESPRKRQKVACKTTEVSTEAVTTRGTKRKSSTDRESPKRKRVCSQNTDTSKLTEVPVESVKAKSPAAETPGTSQRGSGCDLSTSPPTSRQDNVSPLFTIKTSKDFEAEYLQLNKLGERGFGSVYAGLRKTDNFPVAIKHIPKEDVEGRPMIAMTSTEVLLVVERPVPSMDLYNYLFHKGPLEENLAKNVMKQLVEAAIKLHAEGVFHRDIKTENVLVELSSDVPRVWVIDFGCGCFLKKRPYRHYYGTSAYVPPEFYIQGIYEAGPTTVWQLGTLLYELLHETKDNL